MCFDISQSKTRRARAAARKTAYKVVRLRDDGYGPLHVNTHLRYKLGESYTADRGPWKLDDEAAGGLYVCLSLKRAKRMADMGLSLRVIFKVAVKGFRHVSTSGDEATYTSVKFLEEVPR